MHKFFILIHLLYFFTCFEHYCAHLQKNNFISTASGRVQTVRDGTRAETRFGLPAKRTSPFISAGVSVQSSTGFLGVRVERERL